MNYFDNKINFIYFRMAEKNTDALLDSNPKKTETKNKDDMEETVTKSEIKLKAVLKSIQINFVLPF